MPKIPEILDTEITQKYQIADNTFSLIAKDNPKDLVQLELGDSKVPEEMLPQQKIMRWDNEANVWNQIKNMKCPNQIYPVSWLIEKFAPVPGWTEEKIKEL